VLKGGRARLSALETQAVSRGGAPTGGLLECNWRVAVGKMRLEPTEGAQLPRADPGRGKLVVLQEVVDVDVRQLLRLVGFVGCIECVAAVGGVQLQHQFMHLRWRSR